MDLPYLTRAIPGIGGKIKQRDEDFFVEELPLYEPGGQGEHVYCEIEKKGMSTFDAVHRLSEALGVAQREIGYAGMKDARAITRQVVSIWGTSEEAVMGLGADRIPGLSIRWARRHANKLRLGHLAGNRFAIKIRDAQPTDVIKARQIMTQIEQRGMPNYFGEQRFGRRGNNDQLGAALIRGDNVGLLKLLLGSPDRAIDDPQTVQARELFDQHKNEESMKHWPRRSGMERRVLARLMKTHKPASAVRAIDEKLRRLWVSALQSRLFNEVVARRIESLDRMLAGDLAYKHENGACFRVEDAAVEQPRCDAFEISPTGPLLGYRMTLPAGEPLEIENGVFAAAGLTPGEFKVAGRERVKGARRPLRVKPQDVKLEGGVDEHGPYVALAFTLPAGSFATVLLAEVMKTTQQEAAADQPNDSAASHPDPEPRDERDGRVTDTEDQGLTWIEDI
jgi:tRNA pseudouridine13 synthase